MFAFLFVSTKSDIPPALNADIKHINMDSIILSSIFIKKHITPLIIPIITFCIGF